MTYVYADEEGNKVERDYPMGHAPPSFIETVDISKGEELDFVKEVLYVRVIQPTAGYVH